MYDVFRSLILRIENHECLESDSSSSFFSYGMPMHIKSNNKAKLDNKK